MRAWTTAGYFKKNLEIREGSSPDSNFEYLGKVFPDISKAFTADIETYSAQASQEKSTTRTSQVGGSGKMFPII